MSDTEKAGSQKQTEAQKDAPAQNERPVLVPPTDIYETQDAVVLLLDVPGAAPDSLSVTLAARVLTISAQTVPTAPEGYALVHSEYAEGDYERSFALSEQVDRERIAAEFREGVLRVTLPKVGASAVKRIAVKAA
ncbi:MAG TPA: Hsp20/alpha crystallin family protein [Myxococcota bacterium]|nr:Hsp20/alpha crystallin family protein [Myxococcota bacterium]